MIETKVALFRHPKRSPVSYRTPEQLGFWPLNAKRILPPREDKGTNYSGEVIADDGLRYVVKTREAGNHVPFSELVGYELCNTLSIATPGYRLIKMPNDMLAFGSREEQGCDEGFGLASLIQQTPALRGTISTQFSKLIALDSFLPNYDRALKNLLYLNTEDKKPSPEPGSAQIAILAIDFSNAFSAIRWPLPPVGFDGTTKSARFYTNLRDKNLLTASAIGETLDRLANLPGGFFEMLLTKCPEQWLSTEQRNELMDWWSGPHRGMRIRSVEEYLNDELKISVQHY